MIHTSPQSNHADRLDLQHWLPIVMLRRVAVKALVAMLAVCTMNRDAASQIATAQRAAVAAPITPRRLFQIGTGVARDSITFGSIGWVTPQADGGSYVYDTRAQSVSHFDAQGTFLGRIGHAGKGNGAFGQLVGGATYRDSLLALWDYSAHRVVLFHESGAFRRNIIVPMEGRGVASGGVTNFTVDTNGVLYLRIQNGMGSDRFSFLRVGGDGTVIDSVPEWRPRNERRYVSDGMRSTFLPETVRVPSRAGGVLIADPATYRISVVTGDNTVQLIKHEWNPVQTTPGEREEWRNYVNREPPFPPKAMLDSMIPLVKPALRALTSDREGNVWVELHGAARADSTATDVLSYRIPSYWRDRTRYDVFNASGQFQYQVEFPRSTYLMAVDGRRLWLHESVNGKSVIGVYTF